MTRRVLQFNKMDLFIILFGATFIGVGFFVKKFPNLMSPYCYMSEEKKKNVDLKAIASLFQKGFLTLGVMTIGGYYLFDFFKMRLVAELFMVVPIFVITPILLIRALKYDHNEGRKIVKLAPAILVLAIFVVIGISMSYGLTPTKAVVEDQLITFTGQYGIQIPLDQIKKVELLPKRPLITRKINGLAISGISKGIFVLDTWGKCRLFLRGSTPPYLFIERKNGGKILFNSPDSLYTKHVFQKLKQ